MRKLRMVRRGRRGFTLIETITAVALSSVVLLGAGLVIDDAITSQKHVVDHDRAQAEFRLVQSYLQQRAPFAVLPLRQADDHGVEFVTYQGDQTRYVYIGRSCAGTPALVVRTAGTPRAAAYPASGPAVTDGSERQLMQLASCDAMRISYLDGSYPDKHEVGGEPGVPDASRDFSRLTDTRVLRLTLRAPAGPERELEFALGLDATEQARTLIVGGDFERPEGFESPAGTTNGYWTDADGGTATRVAEPGRGMVLQLTPAGSEAYVDSDLLSDPPDGEPIHAPIDAEGEDLQASAKASAGATCAVSVLDYETREPLSDPASTSEAGEWEPIVVPMDGLAGRQVRVRLSASGGTCAFDAVRSADEYRLG